MTRFKSDSTELQIIYFFKQDFINCGLDKCLEA